MRKINALFLIVLTGGVLFAGPHAWTDTSRTSGQGSSRTAASDPLAPFLGSPGRSALPGTATALGDDPLKAAVPAWSQRQEASAESKLGWALLEMTQKTGEVAKSVKDTVKTTLTDYVKEKQQQSRQQELLDKFYANLNYVTANLRLTPHDQQDLTARVQRVYIDDAESGRYQFDSLRFRELPYIVRREYAQMVLERTQDGSAETYHLNGAVKTHWNFKNGQPDGPIITYYENGEINFIDVFKEGRKIRRTKYDEEGKLVFEQNYEYSLSESPVKNQELFEPASGSIAGSGRSSQPASVPLNSQSERSSSESAESSTDALDGLIELPPQVSANHLEV